jgi:hypothetical protein
MVKAGHRLHNEAFALLKFGMPQIAVLANLSSTGLAIGSRTIEFQACI